MTKHYCIYEFDKGIVGYGKAPTDIFPEIKDKEIRVNQFILECTKEFYDYVKKKGTVGGYLDRQFTITERGVLTFV